MLLWITLWVARFYITSIIEINPFIWSTCLPSKPDNILHVLTCHPSKTPKEPYVKRSSLMIWCVLTSHIQPPFSTVFLPAHHPCVLLLCFLFLALFPRALFFQYRDYILSPRSRPFIHPMWPINVSAIDKYNKFNNLYPNKGEPRTLGSWPPISPHMVHFSTFDVFWYLQ